MRVATFFLLETDTISLEFTNQFTKHFDTDKKSCKKINSIQFSGWQ